MPGKIQLVLPGLFDLPLAELKPDLLDNGLPHLNRILRLATPRPNQAYSIDAILQIALAEDDSAQQTLTGLPLAQVFADAEEANANRLLLFKAIHLQAGLHSAVIVPIQENDENLNDITIIINDLKNLFNVDCDISSDSCGLFVMRLSELEAPSHYPHLFSVLGKSVSPYIEQSRQILPWYKLLNEIQMFLHQHEINQDRIERGLLPINSLWFWGAGKQLQGVDINLAWYCDESLFNRFAQSLGLNPRSLANIENLDPSGDAIITDLRLIEALKLSHEAELDKLLLEIDRILLKPLLSAVERHRKTLVLKAGYEFDFELKPAAGLKFWRRPRNLTTWIGETPDP